MPYAPDEINHGRSQYAPGGWDIETLPPWLCDAPDCTERAWDKGELRECEGCGGIFCAAHAPDIGGIAVCASCQVCAHGHRMHGVCADCGEFLCDEPGCEWYSWHFPGSSHVPLPESRLCRPHEVAWRERAGAAADAARRSGKEAA